MSTKTKRNDAEQTRDQRRVKWRRAGYERITRCDEKEKNYHPICLVVFGSHLCARMNEPVVVHGIGIIMQASLCLNVSFVLLYSKSCLLDLYYECDDGVYGRLDSFTSSLMYLTFIHGGLCAWYLRLRESFLFLFDVFFSVFFFPSSSCACFANSIRRNELVLRITKQDEIQRAGRRLRWRKIKYDPLMEAQNDNRKHKNITDHKLTETAVTYVPTYQICARKKEHIERYPNLRQVSTTYKHNTYIWH